MIEVKGKYGTCKIMTNNVDNATVLDIYKILNSPIAEDANMICMPDVHKGMSFPIGTTMKIHDKVIPNGVSVDIGCGVICQKLNKKEIDLKKLDEIMHTIVPSGFSVNSKPHRFSSQIDLTKLRCYDKLNNIYRLILGIGSIGSGNHYCEINKDDKDNLYLVIHTGSRNLGKQIADYYQEASYIQMNDNSANSINLIKQLKAQGREKEIQSILKELPSNEKIEKSMSYCTGQLMIDYLHDMSIAQEYASLNRKAIADTIQKEMDWEIIEEFQTIHNYIELDTMILRKGAVSAKLGEKLIVPLSMAAGSLICEGKGNPDWNYSLNHGAGRLMSRKAAKESINIEDFKKSMEGIYTTCVSLDTIDESPMSYKCPEEIILAMEPNATILNIIKPIYNFKDGGD